MFLDLFDTHAGVIGRASAVSEATLSSSPLRFAVYVGVIVRATRGQRSSCLPCQQFLNLLLSRLLASRR